MAVANTIAYYVTATITAVKSFIVQAPGDYSKKYATIADYIEGKWAKEYRFDRGLYTRNIPV